ncbi:MAG: bifunctional precorrin-2 dehydrogenase/sirohydrochlorin ferrochelatase [Deltaproteobacteria bacterium]|nr:bifunctional precorrin-2 dehydrogenase/sirohydrochlorin ferrochelatase [Deltaproteobacteria bacterium]
MDNKENRYYPIFLDLKDKECVVVGGGIVAARKIESLLGAGAKVTVISPDVISEIANMPGIKIRHRQYKPRDLKDAFLVIAATNNEKENKVVSKEALSRHIFCNVVDQTDLCSFIVPSVVEKGPIKIAISTGGASPSLASKLRREIDNSIGPEYETLARILDKIRPLVLSQEGGAPEHRRIFDVLINSALMDAIKDNDRSLAEDILFQALGLHITLEGIL